jgi:F0F1-type ATP synthase assembly protein I
VRIGFELLVAIFLGALAGYWLDMKTGRAFFPLFSLLGFLLGSSGGLLLVYRTMNAMGRAHPEKRILSAKKKSLQDDETRNRDERGGTPL